MNRTFEAPALDNSDESRLTAPDNDVTDAGEPSQSPLGFAAVAATSPATSHVEMVQPDATLRAATDAERTAFDRQPTCDAAAIDAAAVVEGLLHAL